MHLCIMGLYMYIPSAHTLRYSASTIGNEKAYYYFNWALVRSRKYRINYDSRDIMSSRVPMINRVWYRMRKGKRLLCAPPFVESVATPWHLEPIDRASSHSHCEFQSGRTIRPEFAVIIRVILREICDNFCRYTCDLNHIPWLYVMTYLNRCKYIFRPIHRIVRSCSCSLYRDALRIRRHLPCDILSSFLWKGVKWQGMYKIFYGSQQLAVVVSIVNIHTYINEIYDIRLWKYHRGEQAPAVVVSFWTGCYELGQPR